MRRSNFKGAIAGLIPMVACVVACGNGYSSGESGWRLQEERATSSSDSAHLAAVAASAPTGHFILPVPLGVERSQIAVGATGHVVLGKGVQVTELGGKQFGTVVGMDGVEVGEGAAVGNVYSMGAKSLALGERATVNGFARADSVVQSAPSSSVTVGVMAHANNQVEEYSFTVPFPSSRGQDQAVPANARLDLKAGPWGNLVVAAQATVVLGAGAYYFESVDVERNGTVAIDNSGGPVYLWIRSGLQLSGTMAPYKGTPNILIGYAGSAAPQIGSPLDATLVAPAADVSLPATAQAHVGAIFAHSVAVADGATIVHEAFAPGNADYAAAPDYSGCNAQCTAVYQAEQGNCASAYNSAYAVCYANGDACAAAAPAACGYLAGNQGAYGGCIGSYYSICYSEQSPCFAAALANYNGCQNAAAIQYQQCGCN